MADSPNKSKRIGGIAGLVIIVAAVISVFLIDWDTGTPEPPPVVRSLKTIVVGVSDQAADREYPGRVQASQRVDLSFRISGPLIELPAVEGQVVEEGALIARVDPRDFQTSLADITSRVDEAIANLEAMRQGRPEDIEKLRASVQKAEAASRIAKLEFERGSDALSRGGATQLEIDRLEAEKNRADAELRQAREDLTIGETGARPEDIQAAEARVAGLKAQRDDAHAALGDTSLTAPFDGRIARRFVDNFQMVQAQETIVVLQDVTNVDIIIAVPESDVLSKPGGKPTAIHATFASLKNREFELDIKEFSTEADPATQTYAATLTMPVPDDLNIFPGMTATVHVQRTDSTSTSQAAFVLPIEAAPVDGLGTYFVWKVKDGGNGGFTVHRAEVTVGEMTRGDILVLSGVEPGDRIAAAGVHLLQEGQQVRILESAETEGGS